METLLQKAGELGGMGLTLLACFYFIFNRDKDLKAERTEVAERFEKMHADALSAINNNTLVLSEIKTIINNK